jgi:Xaa-Pro aminopeptidase
MKKSLVFILLIICIMISDASSQLTFEKDEYANPQEKLMEMIPDGIAIIRGASEPVGQLSFSTVQQHDVFCRG